MSNKNGARVAMAAVLGVVLSAGCTTVQTTYEYTGESLPKPDMTVVYNFAGSAGEVKMDSSVLGNLSGRLDDRPLIKEEVQLGRKVADAMAAKLVQEIQAMGLSAMRAGEGQPETERVVIGLGAGRSSVKLNAEVYGRTREGRRLLESLTVDAAGSRKPGMAETMGVGAAGGETFGETVEADAERGAAKLAEQIGKYFEQQGWIPPGSIKPDLVP